VFVSSVSFKGNLGGLTGADAKCQAEADGPASIVPAGTYLAWLIAKFKSGAIPQRDRTAELGTDASAYACFSPRIDLCRGASRTRSFFQNGHPVVSRLSEKFSTSANG